MTMPAGRRSAAIQNTDSARTAFPFRSRSSSAVITGSCTSYGLRVSAAAEVATAPSFHMQQRDGAVIVLVPDVPSDDLVGMRPGRRTASPTFRTVPRSVTRYSLKGPVDACDEAITGVHGGKGNPQFRACPQGIPYRVWQLIGRSPAREAPRPPPCRGGFETCTTLDASARP